MSAPISPVVEASSRQDLCEIEATVTSGFEVVALQDAVEKLGCKVVRGRGRIFIHIPVKQAEKVLQLGGVDNLYVVVKRYEDFNFSKDQLVLQGAVNWPNAYHICGDNHEKAWPRCQQNLDFVREKRRVKGRSSATCDVMKWDVTNLPLRDNTVDVFITDLPFGKRLGSTMDNRVLYPKALTEMARVCKPKTGRACLLTHDRRSIAKAMQAVSHLWHRGIVLWINIGGLAAGVYMLHRNADDGKKERKEARGGQNSAAGQ
ncbi:THUMP domain-containing protein 3-like [Lingula anatina]|uniref:THUMP domain-containing protein 3-like n=1 Tax=Lingula anatina TaxID=7574 RepID=A0A1S3IT45_LINAN|nr:THUMP domain-containing protein 3-like [Lingula anatina]|eukprot:XP_013401372.1 THUMP domain-containing protein 3-like [Lingula anatina]